MKMNLNPYFFFDGHCKEAMEYYKEIFGGELKLLTFGQQIPEHSPPEMHDKILHAFLKSGDLVLLASDAMLGKVGRPNDALETCLNCESAEQLDQLYARLSDGGKADHPPHDTFWGARFGTLKDKYGFGWMLNFDRNTKA